MVKFFQVLILGLVACACGVKKAPTPLYAHPISFETDFMSPSPSPTAAPEATE